MFTTGNIIFGQISSKIQNCQFKLKFGTETNSYMYNSMVFIFSVFHQKYSFCANLVQKIKIVCLSWNLVPRPIRIWRNQWCPLFLFWLETTLWVNLVLNTKIVNLSWKLVSRLICNAEFNGEAHFFRFHLELPFLEQI